MSDLDPRLNAYRPDLADLALKGWVAADRFVRGTTMVVAVPHAPLKCAPAPAAAMESELVMGEAVRVFETTDSGWCWVQACADSYVGWMPAGALAAGRPAPTHRISALRTLVFPAPDIKRPPVCALPLGALVTVSRQETGSGMAFAMVAGIDGEGAVPMQHLVPVEATRPADPVAIAERFVGVPYLWGGRTSCGVDCSGLVQVALQACGWLCPRDTDMQEGALGETASDDSGPAGLVRGDLIFWHGHVGLMQDGARIVHANAHHMAVASEPLADTIGRFGKLGLEISSIRRILPAMHQTHMTTR